MMKIMEEINITILYVFRLIDRSGRTLKMEPLATVNQLENYLLKSVAKQW